MPLASKLADRDPSKNPTPLDRASFYVEELKYEVGDRAVEKAEREEIIEQVSKLLYDAGVTSMTGEELVDATVYYGVSLARLLGVSRMIALSLWLDGLMHGVALASSLEAEPRRQEQAVD